MKHPVFLVCLCALPMSQSLAQDAPKTLASTLEIADNLKKAFGVCLEAKDYLVK